MRILYAIQGTGNGHLTRAMSIVPEFMQRADVDVLLSGIQADMPLPFPVRYRYHGMSFIFGKRGGIDFWNTYRKNHVRKFWQEVKSLNVLPYDLVISDFEPVSAWACHEAGVPCIGLSNQATLLSAGTPRPAKDDVVGRFTLRHYAPVEHRYGFHYLRYNNNIFTPLIRPEVRNMEQRDEGHFTVYLPAYDDGAIIKALSRFPNAEWEVFSKHTRRKYYRKNVLVRPIESGSFMRSMAGSTGIVCAAGFGTTSEALFLGKKMLVIPQKSQFEQQCNATALRQLGVTTMKSLKQKHHYVLQHWLDDSAVVHLNYPDISTEVVNTIIANHHAGNAAELRSLSTPYYLRPA